MGDRERTPAELLADLRAARRRIEELNTRIQARTDQISAGLKNLGEPDRWSHLTYPSAAEVIEEAERITREADQ